mgnify:CR=1 FL=1
MSEHRIGSLALWFTTAALAVAAAGCGESRPEVGVPTYPVQGKVVLGDGEPLKAGIVVFVSDGGASPAVSGTIGRDGAYAVMTDGVVAGAPAGAYKVRVEIDPDAAPIGTSPRKRGGLPFPAKYARESTSGLTATVKAEPANELPPFVLN